MPVPSFLFLTGVNWRKSTALEVQALVKNQEYRAPQGKLVTCVLFSPVPSPSLHCYLSVSFWKKKMQSSFKVCSPRRRWLPFVAMLLTLSMLIMEFLSCHTVDLTLGQGQGYCTSKSLKLWRCCLSMVHASCRRVGKFSYPKWLWTSPQKHLLFKVGHYLGWRTLSKPV